MTSQTMGHSEPDRITVRGLDLCTEVIGKIDFSSMFFLELTGRLPSPGEARVVDAVLVTLVEHGLTPTALATRLTHLGAPGAMQGAVAAGLLGAGEVFLGAIEQCAKVLQELTAVEDPGARTAAIDDYLADIKARRAKVPGIGHPIHKPIDPRTPVLLELGREALGVDKHARTLLELQAAAERELGRVLPINADGAIAAILSDAGFDWSVCRGFAIVARSAGLVGHVQDESRNPIAKRLWDLAEEHVAYRDPGEGDSDVRPS